MTNMNHRATHVAALLNAAGFSAVIVGANEVAITSAEIDDARQFIATRTDHEHDEVGITDRDGTHVALLPVAELPRIAR